MTRADLMSSLRTLTPAAFAERYLFDRIPAVFGSDRELFVSWKRLIGSLIDVDPACISLVGSAATGVSLNPSKNFKIFDDDSDIDVAVISHHHFTASWRYLRMNGARRLRLDYRTRVAWDEHVRNYIYWGTVATDRLLGVLPFGLDWLRAISRMATEKPTLGRDINLRVYFDYDALRSYQVMGIANLRNQQSL